MKSLNIITLSFLAFLSSCDYEDRRFHARYREGDFVYMKLDSARGMVIGVEQLLTTVESGRYYGRYSIRFYRGRGQYEDRDVYSFEVWGEGANPLGEARDSIYILPNKASKAVGDTTAIPSLKSKEELL